MKLKQTDLFLFSFRTFRTLVFLIPFFLFIQSLKAADRYWIATGAANWNNTSSWSATSGGAGGASVPTATDNVFFNGAGGSTGNCAINTNAAFNNITVSSGYTGTITQNSGNNITINGNSIWSGGNFLGGNSSITQIGTFSLSGTSFTCTSGTLVVRNAFTFSSGTFVHNNGTVDLQNNSFAITGSPTFYHLTTTPFYNTLTFNNSLTVAGNFTLNGTSAWLVVTTASGVSITVQGTLYKKGDNYVAFNVGTINARGDINISNTASGGGGSGTFNINGTANQTLTSSSAVFQGRLPNVIINKSSGALSLSGIISVGGPAWTYLAGTLAPGTSTVYFYREPGGTNITVTGTHTLNDVCAYPYYSTTTINNSLTVNNFTLNGSSSNIISVGSKITVNGNLIISGTDNVGIAAGIMDVKGNINISNTGVGVGSTGTITITGTGNQTLSSTSPMGQGLIPSVIIAKTSGSLILSGYISTYGPYWAYQSGSLNPGTSTVYFYRAPGGSNLVISGTHTLNNAILYPYFSASTINNNLTVNNFTMDATSQHSINVNVLTINGNLYINGTEYLLVNSGTVSVKGNITNLNTNNTTGGTTTFSICGTGTQSLTGTGLANQSRLPTNTYINKTGNLVISGAVPYYFNGTVNFVTGTLVSTSAQMAIFAAGSSAVFTNSNNASYVDGPVRKIGNTAFSFPTGKSGLIAPIAISAPALVTDAFTAEYFNTDPNTSYSVSLKDASLHHVSTCEYWTLDRTTGTSNASVTLSWDTRSCGVTNLSELRVARWNGSTWKDHNNSATTGNTTRGTVTSTLVSAFSPFALASITGNNPLPIKLISFSGECSNNKVSLHWATANEIDNDRFDVEQSQNGLDWQVITSIRGNGTTSQKHDYSVEDLEAIDGVTYYRLRQVDFNEKFEYSNTIAINACEKQIDIRIYPNPTSSTLKISGNLPLLDFNVELIDNLGRRVYSKKYEPLQNEMDISFLESGTYLLRIANSHILKNTIIHLIKDR